MNTNSKEKQKSTQFATIYAENFNPIKRMLRKMGFNHSEAEDLTQETFIRAWRSHEKLMNQTDYISWIAHVAVNLAHEQQAKRNNQELYHEEYEAEAELARLPSCPAQNTERNDLLQRVNAAKLKLPAASRHALELTLTGMKQNDIAAKLNIPTGTVKSKISYARKELHGLVYGTGNPFYDSK